MTAAPTRTALPLANPAAGIDYDLFLDCIHCGLCLSACPTYEELKIEPDSPRGRIYLMRAVADGRLPLDEQVRTHLDLCLDCRACESACPSGVRYHQLIEPFRLAMDKLGLASKPLPWVQRMVLRHLFPYAGRDRLALAPARFLQWSGLDRLLTKLGMFKLLPKSLRQMHDMLPELKPHPGRLPDVLPAEGPRRARVALFTGCVADAVYPQTNLATAKVLQRNGCEVVIPRSQGCCGALPYHSGDEKQALRFAAANCDAFGFGPDDLGPIDAIVTNAAGCGAQLKEYGHLLHGGEHAEAGAKLAGKVRDVSEFLMELGPVEPTHPLRLKATYHDACHLAHGQGVRSQPRALLGMIPGLELLPLPESELCCGAAGSYNLTQPEMADRLGARKADRILATGADAVFTGNVGCLMQITRHLKAKRPDFWVAHPIDALWASYSGDRR
ncbi:MAG TPA: (Fe-S)-binding protein [Gemmataceae bacterium]|jgi:glycolate oxidase iron-sulfur subunit